VLLAGKIASADTFEPTHAVIVQNKDDVLVPLLLEQIPSAKAFRDAIESLSPEQQRFAKAFRAMQLESTLFGVAVVEIKPQLERLLKLNADALTKEIRLTQDLMELFIEYQVPSDLARVRRQGEPRRRAQDLRGQAQRRRRAGHDQGRQGEGARGGAQRPSLSARARASRATPQDAQRRPSEYMVRRAKQHDDARIAPTRCNMKSRRMRRAAIGADGGPRPSAAKSAPPTAAAPPTRRRARRVAKPPRRPSPPSPRCRQGRFRRRGGGDRLHAGAGQAIDAKFDKLDEDGAVRPTKVLLGEVWRKKFQKALLAKPSETSLGKDELRTEKNKAFDLLDALSKSGALPLGNCQLHVLIVVTHCFDRR
jgi:hypothetical protein